jgi:hypothetical protein
MPGRQPPIPALEQAESTYQKVTFTSKMSPLHLLGAWHFFFMAAPHAVRGAPSEN